MKFARRDPRYLGSYCLWDCIATKRLDLAIEPKIRMGFYRRHVWPLTEILLERDRKGYRINPHTQFRLKQENEKRGRELLERIRNAANWPDLNLHSTQQVRRLLFDHFGLRPATKTDGGKASVSIGALQRILSKLLVKHERARPILTDLIWWTSLSDSKSRNSIRRQIAVKPDRNGLIYPKPKPFPRLGDGRKKTVQYAISYEPPIEAAPDFVKPMYVPTEPDQVFLRLEPVFEFEREPAIIDKNARLVVTRLGRIKKIHEWGKEFERAANSFVDRAMKIDILVGMASFLPSHFWMIDQAALILEIRPDEMKPWEAMSRVNEWLEGVFPGEFKTCKIDIGGAWGVWDANGQCGGERS